jgi:uncharacterized protein (DUF1697 family)
MNENIISEYTPAMNTSIALLRGINVSGQRMINMKDLKALFQKAGFENVMTYIQSGNIVFGSEEKNTKTLAKKIRQMIQDHYGFDVPVMVLSREDIVDIIEHNPYNDGKKDTAKLHVTLLDDTPDAKLLVSTRDEKYQSDEFHIEKKIIYLYCPDGYGMTKFSTMFFEKKLGVTATTRNWKTIEALQKLVQ